MRKILLLFVSISFLSGCMSKNVQIQPYDFEIRDNGHLYYEEIDLGKVVGEQGSNGIDGINGADGLNGVNGKNGINGVNGVDGKNYEYSGYHPFIDLANYSVGDLLPYNAGTVPFDWVMNDGETVHISSIKFTLIDKFSIEESKLSVNNRLYNAFYPYIVRLEIEGIAPASHTNTDYILVQLSNGFTGLGTSGAIAQDGSFHLSIDHGFIDYYLPVFREIEFEEINP